MRSFARYLTRFSFIQGCLRGVLLFYSRYVVDDNLDRTGYLAATIDKHHLLMSQPPPRMVFVGGSNLAFGLDSPEIERALGYHPVNMALNVWLGLDFMLAEVEPFLMPGDVVLISLGYEHFVDRYDGDTGTLLTVIEIEPRSIQFLTSSNLAFLLDNGLAARGESR